METQRRFSFAAALCLLLCLQQVVASGHGRHLLQKPAPAPPLSCYIGTPSPNSVIAAKLTTTNAKTPPLVCARYSFRCTDDDKSCTKKEALNKVYKWAYVPIQADTCKQMQQAPAVYRDLLCCSKPLCNKPDPKKDPATKIQPGTINLPFGH